MKWYDWLLFVGISLLGLSVIAFAIWREVQIWLH